MSQSIKNPEFAVHMLNDLGKERAYAIQKAFDDLMNTIWPICQPTGRELALVRTKLEEACFFAKKSMAINLDNQQPATPTDTLAASS